MNKRPSPASRTPNPSTVPKPAAASAKAAEARVAAPGRSRSQRSKAELASRDFKTVLARVNRDGWKELKRLSTDTDETFQDIFINALNEYLRARGYSPVVESRVFPKD